MRVLVACQVAHDVYPKLRGGSTPIYLLLFNATSVAGQGSGPYQQGGGGPIQIFLYIPMDQFRPIPGFITVQSSGHTRKTYPMYLSLCKDSRYEEII